MVTDLAVGVLVAAVVLALSLGLAPVGAVAIVTLVVSAASYPLAGRRLRRRLARSSPGRSRPLTQAPRSATSDAAAPADRPTRARAETAALSPVAAGLMAGGTDGNSRLTAITGSLLLVLLAVLGVTIVRIGQLLSVHLFVGLLLIGPVALKLASTGYRFTRYYTGDRAYRLKGPPPTPLRMIAPIVIATTLVVFGSGLVLLFKRPSARGGWTLVHKASFIVWLAFMAVHVLAHLPELPNAFRRPRGARSPGSPPGVGEGAASGAVGRAMALAGVTVAGLVLAILLIPRFAAWTGPGALHHFGH
jgi:hypothetical protein